jgi:FkbM family methyltransferase
LTDALPADSQAQVIVDVGAHIGVTTLRFHQTAPQARILALEPDRENYALLVRNCEGIGAITTLRAALSTKIGTGNLSRRSGFESGHMAAEGAPVETQTLAAVLARAGGQIDVLKMDIEGEERNVFAAQETAECLRAIRCLIVECHEGYAPEARAAVSAALTRSGARWSHRAIDEHDVWTQE